MAESVTVAVKFTKSVVVIMTKAISVFVTAAEGYKRMKPRL